MSERQLARIEAHRVQVRKITTERLAKVLGVDPGVISGAQPLPMADDEVPSLEIDPENLKALRQSKGLSRRALAAKAGVSQRQLARLEASDSTRKVRAMTFEKIAKALDADDKKLSGATPVEPRSAPGEHGHVGIRRVSPQLRLAYDLVCYRYKPTMRQVFELAPLLFVLLAEGSLAWRREHTAKVDEAIQRLEELQDDSHFFFRFWDIGEAVEEERNSIGNGDVLGDEVWYPHGNPFASYLRKLAEELGVEGIFDPSSHSVGWPIAIWGAEPYMVCRDTLGELTGDSEHARLALVHGDVRLSEIPKELLPSKPDDRKDDRIAWLESKLSDEVRRSFESSRKLSAYLAKHLELPNTDAARPTGEPQ